VARLRSRKLAGAALVTVVALVAAGCGKGSGHSSGSSSNSGSSKGTPVAAQAGGTATFALPPGTTPDWIFPLIDSAHSSIDNRNQFEYLMYRPLYWFGQGSQPVLNDSLSLAQTPVFTNNDRTVTINMKPYKWSNGETVTAQDVAFWLNMLSVEKKEWAYYVPGGFPDNLTGWKVTGPTTIQLTLIHPYNPQWFTYNELSQITPLPTAWDKTSATASGSCATSTATCAAVWQYLYAQSKDPASYASSPLWSVVDGPWHLVNYQTTGYAAFKPNPSYSGPIKPKLSEFIEQPFTTESAELNVLRSGSISVGYLPVTDIAQKSLIAQSGYDMTPWIDAGINYFPENFNNPSVGPIFRQLYIRQAMQHLIDQPLYIKAIFDGYASPTYGPVPIQPSNPFVDSYEKSNPYPFNVAAARSLLQSHGWMVRPNGITTCASPGSGSHQCGTGVAAGAKLDFNLTYASGNTSVSQEMQDMKSTFSKVGITLNLSEAPFDQVISQSVPCQPTQASCTWEMSNWGGGWSYSMDHLPNGDLIFGSGAGDNFGSYDNPEADKLIVATETSLGALPADENFLAHDLPAIFMPKADYQLTEVKSNLHGVTPQMSTFNITPEDWYFSSGSG
jgi:peptide/nickel transport system substrate-binding protein